MQGSGTLSATFHKNGSVISLESSTSERDDSPGTSGYNTTQDEIVPEGIMAVAPQQPRCNANHDHASQRPLVPPLNMPELFSQLSLPPATSTSSSSCDGRRDQAIHRGAGTFDANSHSEPAFSNRYERTVISKPEASRQSRLLQGLEKPRHAPIPAPNAQTSSPPSVVPPLPHLPLVQGKLCLPLETICHSKNVQQLMESRRISWGVQYELARGVLAGRWKWEDITDSVLKGLEGLNAVAAPKVRFVMAKAIGEGNATYSVDFGTVAELWAEYDREQDAILERQSRGLGLKGEWKGVKDWYGGRIQQVLRLSKSNGTLHYRLDPPSMQRSNRFARFLGSRRILQIKLAKDILYASDNSITEHLGSRFLFCGRIFAPFASKDSSVYMMELNEDRDRSPDRDQGDDTRISLWDFIDWHNPLSSNMNQPMNKWFSRFDLGLSTSVPVLRFEPENIEFIPDIEARHDQEKTPSEMIFTDGCGFMNGAAFTLIARHLGLTGRPTAVQGRVAGSKGLWMLHPEYRSATDLPRIWIRHSQRKIRLPSLAKDSAHLIFDLVAQSNNITVPSRLNKQLTINLAENGVSPQVFEELLHNGLVEIFNSLTHWDGAGAMPLLWSNVNNLGGVSRSRLQKVARGLARAIGLAKRFDMDREDTEEDDDNDSEAEAEVRSLHSTVLELIQAGFNPKTSHFLYEKMRKVLSLAMDKFLKKYHIEVPQSAEAFIVPDPFGVLEEGQIQFKSLRKLKDPLTETNVCSVRGPVLVSRNPTMIASDIQKVEAIEHELLADYTNVVVFPTKGSRSLASLLAGGDYDGDTVMVNWAPSIVEQYKNPEIVNKPDDFEQNNFVGTVEKVTSFVDRLSQPTPREDHKFFFRAMLQGLGNSKLGKYSKYHGYATYKKGYSHQETVRLAYMFTTCLDSRKTGLRVLENVFQKDVKDYGWGLPISMRGDEGEGESQNTVISRDPALGPFILDKLLIFGCSVAENLQAEYNQPAMESLRTQDQHLLQPYQRISEKLSEMRSLPRVKVDDFLREAQRELDAIKKHVKAMKSEWGTIFHSNARQDRAIETLRRKFASGPVDVAHLALLGDVSEIRASYAYSHCLPSKPNFAFAMAFKDLCGIKAREVGGTTLDREFTELMSIPKSTVRTLSALQKSTM